MKRSRSGFTLVETVLASALLGLVVTAALLQQRAGAAEACHLEDRQDLAAAATLLQSALSRDVRRSLSLDVLEPEDYPRGTSRSKVVLPLQAAYRGDAAKSLHFRRIEYSWTAASRELLRGGKALPLPGVASLDFTWSPKAPTTLTVALSGVTRGLGAAPRLRFVVTAPAGTDSPLGWTPAPHHRGGALQTSD